MNKKSKYLMTITILSLIFCNKVYASCSEIELNHFKEIESKFTLKYDYDTNNNQTIIKYYNPEPDRYMYRILGTPNVVFKIVDKYNYTVTGSILETYTIEVFGLGSGCSETLKTFIVKPPEKVSVLKEEYCEGIEDFVLCQPDYDKVITREEFASRIETYKNSLKKENDNNTHSNENETVVNNNTEKQEEKINFINTITKYIQDNLIKVIIVTVFIILLIVTAIIFIRKSIKSRRLE